MHGPFAKVTFIGGPPGLHNIWHDNVDLFDNSANDT